MNYENIPDTAYRIMRAILLTVTVMPFIIIVVSCRTWDEFLEELLG